MEKLSLYLIKDLTNIVNFYLTLRTIEFKNDVILTRAAFASSFKIYGDISEVYFKIFKSCYYLYIGISNTKNKFFALSYKDYPYNEPEVSLNFSSNLIEVIDSLFNLNEKSKFYEFQNESVK
jgi:hypothetical protein